jgi:NAD(P)-dependent dehydrogenase (short-subunit alcohol dehydrogenase family)
MGPVVSTSRDPDAHSRAFKGEHVVVTGGGNGIGRALAEAFSAEGARVVVADRDESWAVRVAESVGGVGIGCDVGDPTAVARLVDAAVAANGPIDVFCSNAGYSDPAPGDLDQEIDAWRQIVDVNLLSHVWAARLVVPGLVERGHGRILQTISSAALITGPSGPGYTLSKHGALGFAEWLSLRYGGAGLSVTCLCPNAVYTGMFGLSPDEPAPDAVPADIVEQLGEVLMPAEVAAQAIAGLRAGHFLVLPHPRVAESFLRKATDYDGWLDGTRRRLQRLWEAQAPGVPASAGSH